MKKCFSTCLFQAKRYQKSYLNLPKTMSLLKDAFDLVIYHDSSLTKEMKSKLNQYPFVKLIKKNDSIGRSGCFWRYEAYNNYDLIFFRDIDIGIEENDVYVYNDFINNSFNICWIFLVHQRKPYPKQGFVMGGVFGMKKNSEISDMNSLIKDWEIKQGLDHYGSDEQFLANIIYNLIPPIVYYEPRVLNVKLENDYETYTKLPSDYNHGPGNNRSVVGASVNSADISKGKKLGDGIGSKKSRTVGSREVSATTRPRQSKPLGHRSSHSRWTLVKWDC